MLAFHLVGRPVVLVEDGTLPLEVEVARDMLSRAPRANSCGPIWGAYTLDMSMDDAEKALAEILMVDWRYGEQAELNELEGRLRRREEGRIEEQWRGRRGRNIFRAGRSGLALRQEPISAANQLEDERRQVKVRSLHVMQWGFAAKLSRSGTPSRCSRQL